MTTFKEFFKENSSQTLNLLTNKEDVLVAFELMEGKHTLEWQERSFRLGTSRNNIYAAMEWLATKDTRDFPNEGSFTVYGDGGFNRYFVRPNGDIEFSSMHAMEGKKTIQKAKDLGFKILGEQK